MEYPDGGYKLFLTGATHKRNKIVKQTRQNNLPLAAASMQVVIGLCKRKETAALKFKAAVSKGRVNMAAVRRLFFFCRRPAVTFSYLNSNQVYSYFFPTTYIGRNMLHSMITKRTYLPIFSHTTTATLLARRLRIGIRIMLRHKDNRNACTICGQLRLLKLTPGTCIRNGPS